MASVMTAGQKIILRIEAASTLNDHLHAPGGRTIRAARRRVKDADPGQNRGTEPMDNWRRWLIYLAAAALAATVLLAGGAYAFYRSLLPSDLPARPTTTLPPMVRRAVNLSLGGDAKRAMARLHLDRLQAEGRLPIDEGYQKWRLRIDAMKTWLDVHWPADDVIHAYAERVDVGGDRIGLASGAEALFAKSLPQLAPHEVALLMGVAYAPSKLDPACHPVEARKARDAFLAHMADARIVAAEDLPSLQAMPVDVRLRCAEAAIGNAGIVTVKE
jgi:hypothetical protein